MKIGKIFLALTAFVTLASFESCKNEIDDVFDKNASLRVEETIRQDMAILASAPNGWVMEVYGNTQYGGFNVLAKFTDEGTANDRGMGHVTVANELFNKELGNDTTITSGFKMEQSGGIILSFDEYNEFIHFFSDPVNPQNYGSGTADGFGGDHEYRVINVSSSAIELIGKKSGSRVMMYPLPANIAWKDYMERLNTVSKGMYSINYKFGLGLDSLKVKLSKRERSMTYIEKNAEGVNVQKSVPYIFTYDGLKFYEPLTFAGRKLTKFNYVDGADVFTSNGVEMKKYTPNLNELFVEGAWFITKADMGTLSQRNWKTFEDGLAAHDMSLRWAIVGTFRTRFGVSVVCGNFDEGFYLGEAYFDYTLIGNNEIRMRPNGEYDDNNGAFFDTWGFSDAYSSFGKAASQATFVIQADNPKDPTYLIVKEKNRPSNSFKLYGEDTLYVPDEQTEPSGQE